VAGKLAWDRLHTGADGDLAREYRLHEGESVPDGIRRLSRGQLDNAVESLEGASDRELGEAVHEARKALKRLRASLRVTRAALGEETYQRENAAFRQAGRRLAAPRDTAVLIETLDGVNESAGDELPEAAIRRFRAGLEAEHEQALEALRSDGLRPVLVELGSARLRTGGWTFGASGFDALAPGLRRVYRRGRRRMRAAAGETSDENLHEWRKRVKDLWDHLRIVRGANPEVLVPDADRAHELSDRLGDHHDLAVLAEDVTQRDKTLHQGIQAQAIRSAIRRRQAELVAEAFKIGEPIYAEKPKQFSRRIESYWTAWRKDRVASK
jgi:CHAD domain-containing protein